MSTIDVIVAVRNKDAFERCLLNSLKSVIVPDGWNIEIVGMSGREGKAVIYDAAMKESTAEYKVYIDENCRITNDRFFVELLEIFAADKDVGAIGIAGTKQLPMDGIYEHSTEFVGNDDKIYKNSESERAGNSYEDVVAVDSCVLATAVDVEWRKDLFGEDPFVVSSQCLEIRRSGKKVVVPNGGKAWVRNRKFITESFEEQEIFLKEYGTDFLPLVTVLIPTYNRPVYFKQALESVINQTYKNIEIIVSDDGDNTLTEELIKPYLLSDKRIKYIHHENYTASENWGYLENYDNPRSEYVAWLMDDDLFLPEKLETMVRCYIQNKGVTLVTSKRQLIDAAGKEMPDNIATAPVVDRTSRITGQIAGALLLKEVINYIGEPSTVLIKKEYLKDGRWLGGFFYKKGSPLLDVATWLSMLERGDMIYIRETLSCFRMHEGQDQRNINTIEKALISWALLIQYYWNKRVFLSNDKDYRLSVCKYLEGVSGFLLDMEKQNYDSERLNLLRKIYADMANSLIGGYETGFTVPDSVWN